MRIDVQHIGKPFGPFTTLSDVSLHVPDRQPGGALGPIGGGRTTRLRVIAGLESPDSGRLQPAGRDMTRAGPSERGSGFVFQPYALFKHMTVLGTWPPG